MALHGNPIMLRELLLQILYGFSAHPGLSYASEHIVRSDKGSGRPTMEQISNRTNQKLTLFTAHEAAEYLRVSLSTLNRIERRGLIQPLRTPGGHRRYTLEMLNECLTHRDLKAEVG